MAGGVTLDTLDTPFRGQRKGHVTNITGVWELEDDSHRRLQRSRWPLHLNIKLVDGVS